ncbi:MAG: NAD(P)/FAD-dependent oxidoreductase [Bacteroidota bacterium]
MDQDQQNYYDVIIIGAGISGISAAYHLQSICPSKTFVILEARQNIGGTWDLFKYPGIRSDSDMYTLGFSFRPWTNPKAIADGPAIMEYLEETVEAFQLNQHIHFGQKAKKADWSTETAKWNIEVEQENGTRKTYTGNFLFGCGGYYDYDEGFMPDFKGIETFQGQVIHPQQWPEDLDYQGKKMVIIGSGATAITLLPALAEDASHVTMLQRSPTYILTAPAEDRLANFFNKYLPHKLAYTLTRWKKITIGRLFYRYCRRKPKKAATLIKKGVIKALGEAFDVDKHFTPTYNPWDQRVCFAPDNDFFLALRSDKADIVTDHIEMFTETGIQLSSGEHLEADIIVSATGLKLIYFAGIEMTIDGESRDPGSTVTYKGMMFNDVPNMAQAFGYTNASWTLKCDLTSKYVARLLKHMEQNGYRYCVPRQRNPDLELEPFVDFNSGYILRHIDEMPKQGKELPWKLKQDYFADRKMIGRGKLEDGVMEFV